MEDSKFCKSTLFDQFSLSLFFFHLAVMHSTAYAGSFETRIFSGEFWKMLLTDGNVEIFRNEIVSKVKIFLVSVPTYLIME